MANNSPRLPPEVVDYIFQFLRDDKPTTATCSLVCWSWVPLTRNNLFRTVILRCQHPQEVQAFEQLLLQPNTFGRHVRCLCIIHTPTSSLRHILTSALAQYLPLVETLRLVNSGEFSKDEFLGMVSSFPHLQNLHLEWTSMSPEESFARDDLTGAVCGFFKRLKNLRCRSLSFSFLSWLGAAAEVLGPMSNLEMFHIRSINSVSDRVLKEFLLRACPNLLNLNLQYNNFHSPGIDLSRQTRLEYLTLSVVHVNCQRNYTPDQLFRDICGMLLSSNVTTLKELTFDLREVPCPGSYTSGLTRLDRLLTERFQQLSSVVFSNISEPRRGQGPTWCTTTLKDLMPSCGKRGLLHAGEHPMTWLVSRSLH